MKPILALLTLVPALTLPLSSDGQAIILRSPSPISELQQLQLDQAKGEISRLREQCKQVETRHIQEIRALRNRIQDRQERLEEIHSELGEIPRQKHEFHKSNARHACELIESESAKLAGHLREQIEEIATQHTRSTLGAFEKDETFSYADKRSAVKNFRREVADVVEELALRISPEADRLGHEIREDRQGTGDRRTQGRLTSFDPVGPWQDTMTSGRERPTNRADSDSARSAPAMKIDPESGSAVRADRDTRGASESGQDLNLDEGWQDSMKPERDARSQSRAAPSSPAVRSDRVPLSRWDGNLDLDEGWQNTMRPGHSAQR